MHQRKLPNLLGLKNKSIVDVILKLGGIANIRDDFVGFQQHLY